MNTAHLSQPTARRPQVLCLSGHDPSGGAGIQADIEAIAAQGAHALGVITALTVQNSQNVQRVVPIAVDLFAEQLEVLLDDCHIDAIKIGVIGDARQVSVIARTIDRLQVPVILDPVLRAGGGGTLAGDQTAAALMHALLPRASIITPNAAEARLLVPDAPDLDAAARALLAQGCQSALVTGGDEPTEIVENSWHRIDLPVNRYHWPRVALGFHGAGCTLASTLAARVALGDALPDAVENAQRAVQAALARALTIGKGRAIPGRIARA